MVSPTSPNSPASSQESGYSQILDTPSEIPSSPSPLRTISRLASRDLSSRFASIPSASRPNLSFRASSLLVLDSSNTTINTPPSLLPLSPFAPLLSLRLPPPSTQNANPLPLLSSLLPPLPPLSPLHLSETVKSVHDLQQVNSSPKRSLLLSCSPHKRKVSERSSSRSSRQQANKRIPSPVLFYLDENHSILKIVNEGGFFPKGIDLTLEYVGKGKHHKCWVTELMDGKRYAIKTINGGSVGPDDTYQVFLDTIAAYEALIKRTDISVATLYRPSQIEGSSAQVWDYMEKDGFHVWDYIDSPLPIFCEAVEQQLMKFVRGISAPLADFRPANVKIIEGRIIIIDPSKEVDPDYPLNLYLTSTIKNWFTIDGRIDSGSLSQLIDKFNGEFLTNPLTAYYQKKWDLTLQELKENIIPKA